MIGRWFLPRFMASAGLDRAHYVVLLPPVTTCVDRVARRIGHGFKDESATRRMHAEFARAAVERRHVFADPAPDVREVVQVVLERLERDQLAIQA